MWIKIILYWIYFVGNTYNRVYIWCCASKHTGLLNSCLGIWHQFPYLVVPLISTRVPLISTRVSAHCQAILLINDNKWNPLFSHSTCNVITAEITNLSSVMCISLADHRGDRTYMAGFLAKYHLLLAERERLSLSAFLKTEDIGVHIVHISRLIITYTLE